MIRFLKLNVEKKTELPTSFKFLQVQNIWKSKENEKEGGCQLSINVVPFCLLILYLVHPAIIENKPLMVRAFKFIMENKRTRKKTELVTSSKSHLAHNTKYSHK